MVFSYFVIERRRCFLGRFFSFLFSFFMLFSHVFHCPFLSQILFLSQKSLNFLLFLKKTPAGPWLTGFLRRVCVAARACHRGRAHPLRARRPFSRPHILARRLEGAAGPQGEKRGEMEKVKKSERRKKEERKKKKARRKMKDESKVKKRRNKGRKRKVKGERTRRIGM